MGALSDRTRFANTLGVAKLIIIAVCVSGALGTGDWAGLALTGDIANLIGIAVTVFRTR